jgi:hypothetical protein
VIRIFPEFDEQVPPWDVALEALLRETSERLDRPLAARDIHQLSQEYLIRFDDLMVTLLELAARGRWQYSGADGTPHRIGPEEMERIRGAGRLDADDLARLTGRWRPGGG